MSVKAGFSVLKSFEGQKDFDTTYKSIEIKKKLVPLGPADEKTGEVPYTEEEVEVITETPIKDVIAAQNESCGLEAYLKPYKLAGTMPPDAVVTDEVQDFTQFDEAGDLRVSGKVDELYDSLPIEIKEKYGTPEKLVREFGEAALLDFIKSKIEKPVEKKEEENNE